MFSPHPLFDGRYQSRDILIRSSGSVRSWKYPMSNRLDDEKVGTWLAGAKCTCRMQMVEEASTFIKKVDGRPKRDNWKIHYGFKPLGFLIDFQTNQILLSSITRLCFVLNPFKESRSQISSRCWPSTFLILFQPDFLCVDDLSRETYHMPLKGISKNKPPLFVLFCFPRK